MYTVQTKYQEKIYIQMEQKHMSMLAKKATVKINFRKFRSMSNAI